MKPDYTIEPGPAGCWLVRTGAGLLQAVLPTQSAALLAVRYLRSTRDLHFAEARAKIEPRDGCAEQPKPCPHGAAYVFEPFAWCAKCHGQAVYALLSEALLGKTEGDPT